MGQYDDLLLRNAERINSLREQIHLTFRERHKNEHKKRTWSKACTDFRAQYPELAFPGGLDGAYDRIIEGDPYTLELALSFIECRPYFFRSGYMYKDFLRKLKSAPLNKREKERYEKVYEAYLEYRKNRHA